MSNFVPARLLPLCATAVALILLYSVASVLYGGFFSWYQFTALFADNASLGLAAIGMTFVILSGGIDLSVGAVIALASISFAQCVSTWNLSGPLSVAVVLIAGATFGIGHGSLIHAFKLPPFLVTLAGMFIARGTALLLTETKRVPITSESIYETSSSLEVARFSFTAIVFAVAVLLAIYLAHARPFGRAVYAIGGDEHSAMLMGLPVGRTKVLVYGLSGMCAACGGILHALGTGAGDATAGYLLELDAIAAVVIGGTLLTGGVGYVFGTLFGVLIIGIIQILPAYQGNLNSWWTKILIGALLLAFVLLQRVLHRNVSSRGNRV